MPAVAAERPARCARDVLRAPRGGVHAHSLCGGCVRNLAWKWSACETGFETGLPPPTRPPPSSLPSVSRVPRASASATPLLPRTSVSARLCCRHRALRRQLRRRALQLSPTPSLASGRSLGMWAVSMWGPSPCDVLLRYPCAATLLGSRYSRASDPSCDAD